MWFAVVGNLRGHGVNAWVEYGYSPLSSLLLSAAVSELRVFTLLN